VPRIGKEYERFAFMSKLRDRTTSHMQRCIDAGALPAEMNVHAAMRMLFASVIGLVALRLSDRLAPWEDPDALVRQSIEVMLAGFQKVPPRGGDAPEGTFHQACRPSR
jgi:hypothetical protein